MAKKEYRVKVDGFMFGEFKQVDETFKEDPEIAKYLVMAGTIEEIKPTKAKSKTTNTAAAE